MGFKWRALETHDPQLPVILVFGTKTRCGNVCPLSNIKYFLSKPYNKDMLGRSIREVLDKDETWPKS